MYHRHSSVVLRPQRTIRVQKRPQCSLSFQSSTHTYSLAIPHPPRSRPNTTIILTAAQAPHSASSTHSTHYSLPAASTASRSKPAGTELDGSLPYVNAGPKRRCRWALGPGTGVSFDMVSWMCNGEGGLTPFTWPLRALMMTPTVSSLGVSPLEFRM